MNSRETRKARQHIHDGSSERRQAEAQSAIARAEQDVPRLEEKIRGTAQDYRTTREAWTGKPAPVNEAPRVDLEARAKARRMLVGAWAAGLLEVVFAAFVSAYFLNLSPIRAALTGIVLAVLTAFMVEGARMKVYQSHRPLQSLRSAERWIGIAFWVAMLGLVPLVAARTLEWASGLTNVSLGILTLTLPTLTGSLFFAAFILRWSERYTREYERLLAERRETTQFLRDLRSFSGQPDGNGAAPPLSHLARSRF